MKAIVLAAGYATRLHPLTENQPKPLLNVGDKPIVERIVEKIDHVEEIDEIFIVTNQKFYPMFQVWLESYHPKKKIKVINDGTLTNDDRLGAIGDFNFVLQQENIQDSVLMIAGDNLFGLSLRDFVSHQKEKNSSLLAFYDLKEKSKVANKFGVGILDENKKVIDFEEKPADPRSTLAATVVYAFSKEDIKKVSGYVNQGEKWDNPGDFAKWLAENSELQGYTFDEHWFDIGSFEGLEEANKFYEELE